jgi:hypothetical protein
MRIGRGFKLAPLHGLCGAHVAGSGALFPVNEPAQVRPTARARTNCHIPRTKKEGTTGENKQGAGAAGVAL